MSERERWVVYPLLFLALGVALRDKLIKTTASQRVQTESLLVTGTGGEPLAVLGNARFDQLPTGRRDILQVDVLRADQIEVDSLIVRRSAVTPQAVVGRLVASQFVQQLGNWSIDLTALLRQFIQPQTPAGSQPAAPPANQAQPPTATPPQPATPTPPAAASAPAGA